VRLRRVDDARKILDCLLQTRLLLDGILPDRECLAGEVHLAFGGVTIEHAGFFVVEVRELQRGLPILKEPFIGADDLRVLL
jgi:hypothetical protein